MLLYSQLLKYRQKANKLRTRNVFRYIRDCKITIISLLFQCFVVKLKQCSYRPRVSNLIHRKGQHDLQSTLDLTHFMTLRCLWYQLHSQLVKTYYHSNASPLSLDQTLLNWAMRFLKFLLLSNEFPLSYHVTCLS